MQTRLVQRKKVRYRTGPQINYLFRDVHRLETFSGCPNECPFCYEPRDQKVFKIPKILSKNVQILDMNFLAQPNVIERIKKLPSKKVYEAVSGFDYRFLTKKIACLLKKKNFIKPRLAWDWGIKDQYKIKDALKILLKAGYKSKNIGMFMITNWKIPLEVCELKLDLLKIWNVKVCDCCYNGGYKRAIPEFWTQKEIDYFRAKCALHDQSLGFGIYADLKRAERFLKRKNETLQSNQ